MVMRHVAGVCSCIIELCNMKLTKQMLQQAVDKRWSTYRIAQESDCGQTNVRYWLKKFDLPTKIAWGRSKICTQCQQPYSGRGAKFCGQKCRRLHQYETFIKDWKTGKTSGNSKGGGQSVSIFIRRYLFEKFDFKCSKCGWAKKNQKTNKVPLTIDHKDGNSLNSSESNLDLLCPNCHSLTPTYGALNKGRGRKNRHNLRV